MLINADLKILLENQVIKYNQPGFISGDPIEIPHRFTDPHDIAISGFLAATIAWGQRKSIVKSAHQLINWMDASPYDFIKNASEADLKPFNKFVYRTFNGNDCVFFIQSLKNIYQNHGGLQGLFHDGFQQYQNIKDTLVYFNQVFFEIPHLQRTTKHIANPVKGSSAKRLNMYLRWMVRSDKAGVDFGLWKFIPASALMIPLDLHVGNVARHLNLLERKQNDWIAVEELTSRLKEYDKDDPAKYDFALFGMGVNHSI
jgi:uncharacterized protein (TIGR02757 family)